MTKEFSTYGARLTYAMTLREMDRRELADRVEVTPQIVGTWMKAEKAPGGRSPKRVALALQLDPHWLSEGVGTHPMPSIQENMVCEAQAGFSTLNDTFTDVDPLVMGQPAQAIQQATSRLRITLEEERLGQILFFLLHKAQSTGEKPCEAWVLEAILNP